MKHFKSLMYRALFFSLIYTVVFTQNKHIDRFTFDAACNRFWQDDSTAYLEIGTEFLPHQITLVKDSTGYQGNIELKIKILNTLNGKYVHADRFHIPFVIRDSLTLQTATLIVNKFNYILECGSYVLELVGLDQANPSRSDSIKIPVIISPRPQMTALSDLDLSTNILESDDKTNPFYKNSFLVVPNPSLLFGGSTAPVVYTYVELYNLSPDTSYILKTQMLDGNGKVTKERSRNRRFITKNTVDVSTFSIVNIASGKYRFVLLLNDLSGRNISRTEKPIFIYNPNNQKAGMVTSSAKSAELAGLTSDELSDEFRKAQYIAIPDDIKLFNKLATADGMREFLSKFWSKIENGQHGQTDLTRAIYLDRVTTANQRYHALGKEGWQTDRGRVYLLYAEPDEVQRFPSSNNGKPYEIWNYNQIESGVIFVFIDQNGFGDYRLVHSTKRGELQDESWQQHLQ